MGQVFRCDCDAHSFLDSIDNRSYAARYIPDQDYDEFSTLVDDAIEKSGPTPSDKDAACMAWRRGYWMPMLWQCPACGSLYVEAADAELYRFTPASPDVPKRLLGRRPVDWQPGGNA
jgi:hypothetical protein